MEENLFAWFKSEHIDLRREWLTEVVGQLPGGFFQLPPGEQRRKVYQKWLEAAISDSSRGLVEPVGTLVHHYVVEISAYSDIGQSAFGQLRKYNENDDYDEDSETTHFFGNQRKTRTLELELSDGTKKFNAMEHTPWSITLPISKGTKLLLKPPIKVKNRMLLLTDQNLEVLGGGGESERSVNEIEINHLERRIIKNGGTIEFKRKDQGATQLDALKATVAKTTKKPPPKPVIKSGQRKMNDFFKPPQPKPKKEEPVKVEVKDEEDEWDDDFDEVMSTQLENEPKIETGVKEEVFEDDDWDDDLTEDVPVSTEGPNMDVKYLCQLEGLTEATVYATISTVKGKITIDDFGLSLQVEIVDGTGALVVKLSHQVMEQLFECPFERSTLKKSKKKLKERNKTVQTNLQRYLGGFKLIKDSAGWVATLLCDISLP